MKVYPRVCGGTSTANVILPLRNRSIPACAGEPAVDGITSVTNAGLSPACAGEPGLVDPGSRVSEVYPRVCGGTSVAGTLGNPLGGLSPRVRGNRQRPCSMMAARRSIPACAGEPTPRLRPTRTERVYPRVCGGTIQQNPETISGWGLSPRVRGNQPRLHNSTAVKSVYPRVCGGTGAGTGGRAMGRRSIPACAGEPLGVLCWHRLGPVYPRVCGGTHRKNKNHEYNHGLSPRVRGNQNA